MANSDMSISQNRQLEYEVLRNEIIQSDRTCLAVMGSLIVITGGMGALFLNSKLPMVGVFLNAVWYLGFWYLSEKRFAIKRIAFYLREKIEKSEEGFGWETATQNSRVELRPVLRFGPYYLEICACWLTQIGVCIIGLDQKIWTPMNPFFMMCVLLAGGFTILAVMTLRAYRHYNERLIKYFA